MGLSTGGGLAFHLAQKHPDIITSAFLVHSIPLSGLKYLTINNELIVLKSMERSERSTILPCLHSSLIYQQQSKRARYPFIRRKADVYDINVISGAFLLKMNRLISV